MKIVSLLVTVASLFNGSVYGTELSNNIHLRVPIQPETYKRIEDTQKDITEASSNNTSITVMDIMHQQRDAVTSSANALELKELVAYLSSEDYNAHVYEAFDSFIADELDLLPLKATENTIRPITNNKFYELYSKRIKGTCQKGTCLLRGVNLWQSKLCSYNIRLRESPAGDSRSRMV